MSRCSAAVWLTLPLLLLTGCEDPAAKYQAQFLLDAEPTGGKTVIEVRDALLATGDTEQQTTTVTGQIGGMPNPYGDERQPNFPWRADEAVFFLVDPTTAAQFGDHGHAPGEECSFCLAKARGLADTVAFVQVSGNRGKPLPYPANELLELTEGATVTVTGKASRVGDLLIIDATGIHVGG